MTAPAARRRPRRTGDAQTLARLQAAREQLDADVVTRRQREDGLLREYADITDTASAITERREAALADLERRAAHVRVAAQTELQALESRRGRVLTALNADRSAEELAQLLGLPTKRVRTLLRAYRDQAGRPGPPTEATPPTAATGDPAAASTTRDVLPPETDPPA